VFNIRNISALGRVFYPSLLWNLPTKTKTIYLTFDDGPIPEITPWVLSLLKEYNAKGTFFCIGENIVRHPEIFQQILSEGHRVGNHSFNHLNGWKTSSKKYVENVLFAESRILNLPFDPKAENGLYCQPVDYSASAGKLFRPPYGKIKPGQIRNLQQRGYKIVMWDVLSEDYDSSISAEKCFRNVTNYAKPGSIIVFHDSLKASANLQEVLPKVLSFFKKQGFEFKRL